MRQINAVDMGVFRKNLIPLIIFLVFICLIALYFCQIPDVPFHPDEATYLYMSGDLTTLISDPMQIAQNNKSMQPLKYHYRLIDAPLGNYWMGFWVLIANEKPIQQDWDWTASWEENIDRGAMPGTSQLTIARISSALLFPVSIILAVLIANRTFGSVAALTTLVLMLTNALFLLHTRRAMHESISLVTIYILLWLLPNARKRPWMLGIVASLAFNAKQSVIPLIFLALLLLVIPENRPYLTINNLTGAILRLIKLSIPFLVIFILLNPIYWKNPVEKLVESLHERRQLTLYQYSDFSWEPFPNSIPESLLVILGDLFFRPPSFAEISNYSSNTANQEAIYLANPINNLYRGTIAGTIFLSLTIFGIVVSIRTRWKSEQFPRNHVQIYIFALFSQLAFNLIFLNLPWQRYVIPIIPYVILFSSCGVQIIVEALTKKIAPA